MAFSTTTQTLLARALAPFTAAAAPLTASLLTTTALHVVRLDYPRGFLSATCSAAAALQWAPLLTHFSQTQRTLVGRHLTSVLEPSAGTFSLARALISSMSLSVKTSS